MTALLPRVDWPGSALLTILAGIFGLPPEAMVLLAVIYATVTA